MRGSLPKLFGAPTGTLGVLGNNSPEGKLSLPALQAGQHFYDCMLWIFTIIDRKCSRTEKSPRKQRCKGTIIFLPFYVQPFTGCFHCIFFTRYIPALFICLLSQYSRAIITDVSSLLYYTILQIQSKYNWFWLIYVKSLAISRKGREIVYIYSARLRTYHCGILLLHMLNPFVESFFKLFSRNRWEEQFFIFW